MISKKILLPALVGSAFFLGACGGDTSPSAPVNNPVYSSTVLPTSSSAYIPGPTSSTPVPVSSSAVVPTSSTPAPSPTAYPALAPSANVTYGTGDYALWKSFHFTTYEQEITTYPNLAAEFNVVFPTADLLPAGRVVWSSQTGYYKSYCSDNTTPVPAMKTRACTVSEGVG
jgi:hypothetical protein